MRKTPRMSLATWRRLALVSGLLFFSLLWILADSVLSLTERAWAEVEIPALCGRAESELAEYPYLVLHSDYRYDETAEKGTVIAQSPRAGTRRRIYGADGRIEVRLTVSLGREERTVPALVGRSAAEAVKELQALSLTASVRRVCDPSRVGRVLSQEPPAGAVLSPGETVVLWVGAQESARTVRVPRLLGMSRAEALLALAAAGLSLGELSETEGGAGVAGTVVAQSHLPDTAVLEGTKISMTVAKESE